MAGKSEFRIPNSKFKVGLVFLVCGLLLSGCGLLGKNKKGQTTEVKEVEKTPVEAKKAELLKEIERKFENSDAHFQLGQLYQADGMWAKAEYHYNIALRFDPARRDVQAAMVKVLADSGQVERSVNYADIYMNQVASSAAGSLRLALGFQKQGLDDYALACYQQALHLAPNSAKIHRQIGYYYLSKGDKERAKDYLSRSFQLNPNQPEVAGELGRLGVAIKIPRKTEKDTQKLDKIVEQSDKEAKKSE